MNGETTSQTRRMQMKRRLLFDLFILSLFLSALLAGAILYFAMKEYALKTADRDAQRITEMVAAHISSDITEHQRMSAISWTGAALPLPHPTGIQPPVSLIRIMVFDRISKRPFQVNPLPTWP
jgi:hypothetical protein